MLIILLALLSVAFLTLLERKILGLVGFRPSPNKVSLFGILQPFSDAVKLGNKQLSVLVNFSSFFYYFSACLMLCCSLVLWSIFMSEPSPVSIKYSLLVFMSVLAIASLNSISTGWSSFSKYPLLGSMRTVAQMISYESCLYMCIFFILYAFLSFSFSNFKTLSYLSLLIPFCFFCWWPSFLAELNRTPYDFSEGESELVSGFNTEYGSNSFTVIFLSEYSNIIFFSLVSSFIFFSSAPILFFLMFLFFCMLVRSVLPRFRFDKLMYLAWKFLIPFLTCCFLCFCVSM